VEISGTEGTLVLPDPNYFEGDSRLWRFGHEEPTTIAAAGSTYGRGSGVLDLARSLRQGGEVHANGKIAAHVLDVLIAVSDAAESGTAIDVVSTVGKPTPLPETWDPAAATL
jgi:predicted dehydrogenase